MSHCLKVFPKLSHFPGSQRFIPLESFLRVRVSFSPKAPIKCLSDSTLLISSDRKSKLNCLKVKRKHIGSYLCKDQRVAWLWAELGSGDLTMSPRTSFSFSICPSQASPPWGTLRARGFHFSQFYIQRKGIFWLQAEVAWLALIGCTCFILGLTPIPKWVTEIGEIRCPAGLGQRSYAKG